MLPQLSVCVLLSLQVLLVLASASGPSTKSRPPLDDPSWALGLRLYRALRADSSSANTLFSPLLVASSLAGLGVGSAGATASQLQDLLQTQSQPGERLSAALKSLTEGNGTGFHLHTSSVVFSKQSPPLSPAFVKESQAKFKLQHKQLGKGDAKADLKQLHGWAKAGLGGLEGVPLEAVVQAKTGALIVANTLRFKGLWEREFSEDSADRRTFLGKKYTKVLMMHRAGLYRRYEDVENMVQVLEATLWGGKASLVLLLPFHVESLSRLDKLLSLELLSTWLQRTNVTSVAVSLPVVNVSSALSLQKQLSALGLTDAWDQKVADFTGVADKSKGKLYLGDVLHWACLELSPMAGEGSADLEEENVEKPKLFYADHPFIIFVRDNSTGALLLMGALDLADGEALHDEL